MIKRTLYTLTGLVLAALLTASCTPSAPAPGNGLAPAPDAPPAESVDETPASATQDETATSAPADEPPAADTEQVAELQNQGLKEAQRGNFKEALPYFLEAEKHQPDNKELLGQIGSSLKHLQRHEEALPYFKRITDLDPGDYKAHINIGLLQKGLGNYQEAIETFEHVLAIKPAEKLALASLADLGFETKDYDMCRQYIERYKEAIAAEDQQAWTQWERAGAQRALRRFRYYTAEIDKEQKK